METLTIIGAIAAVVVMVIFVRRVFRRKGIKVIWPPTCPAIEEIEYFYGIDVNQLDDIPKFTRVRADCSPTEAYPNWPKSIEYVVTCERTPVNENEVHLAVTYDQGNNPEIVRLYRKHGYRDIAGLWGTNTIVLTQGMQCGHCEWLGLDGTSRRGRWESFADCARQPRTSAR